MDPTQKLEPEPESLPEFDESGRPILYINDKVHDLFWVLLGYIRSVEGQEEKIIPFLLNHTQTLEELYMVNALFEQFMSRIDSAISNHSFLSSILTDEQYEGFVNFVLVQGRDSIAELLSSKMEKVFGETAEKNRTPNMRYWMEAHTQNTKWPFAPHQLYFRNATGQTSWFALIEIVSESRK